jgi:hypothetical protein
MNNEYPTEAQVFQSKIAVEILDVFLYDGGALMEDLFIYFIENSKEQILNIKEDSDIDFFFKDIPLKIL